MNALARLVGTIVRPRPGLVAWGVLLFLGSSVPVPEGPPVDFPLGVDKIVHCLAYALLAVLAVRVVWRAGMPWWLVAAAALGATAYGALLEGWQALLGNRGCELGDGIANAIGATVGAGLAAGAYVERRARARRGKEPAGHGERQRRETD